MEMKQIDVAVIGCGQMGETDVTTLESVPEVRRIVGYDPLQSQLDKLKELHPNVEVTTNLDDVMNDDAIKLVYITSSNSTHVPMAVRAMRAGKAVMTEKPSGINYEQIEELLRVQKETGAFLQVGLECRYSWAYLEAKKIIDSGEIGQLKTVHYTYSQPPAKAEAKLTGGDRQVNWRLDPKNSGNMYLEKLCHYIDLVRWWNQGSRVDKYVVTTSDNVIPYYGIEDNVHVSYHFDNGCTSHLYFVMTAAPSGNTGDLSEQDKLGHKLNFVLVGTEGAIEIDVFQRQLRVYHHPGKDGVTEGRLVRTTAWNKDTGKGEGWDERVYFHNTDAQNKDIVRRVLAGEPPAIDPEDAQETMRLCMEFSDAINRRWEIIER